MIAFLRGRLVQSMPTQALLDVGGVGYQVHIPASTLDKLPPEGSEAFLHTYWHIHERGQALYGFHSREERDLFLMLINHVSGLGPKLGLAILTGMSVERFQQAVVDADVKALSELKGVGKKTAERILVELSDKVGVTAAWRRPTTSDEVEPAGVTAETDALLGLLALQYKQQEAAKALTSVRKSPGWNLESNAQEWLRAALRFLN